MRNVNTQVHAVFGSVLDDMYVFPDNSTLRRESGKTPEGNDMNGQWVYRDANGNFVEYSTYRHDLADRFNLVLYKKTV